MRTDALCEMARIEPGCRFVIPDASMEELVKSDSWEETLRRSFAILEPSLERVFFSAALGKLIRFENRTGRPVGRAQFFRAMSEPG